MYDTKTATWKCGCGAADHYSCLCEPTTRYAEVAKMRNERRSFDNCLSWCGTCLQPVNDETWLSHDCDGRPEMTDADRMTIEDFKLHKGWTIETDFDGETIRVMPYRIDRRSGKVWGTRWESGHYGEKYLFAVAKSQPLKVFSRNGAELFKGVTEAEINAMDAAHRVGNSGRKVRVYVTAQYSGIYVHLYIASEDMWGSSYSFSWNTTRPEFGRSTTRQAGGWENRSFRDSKRQKYSRKLTGKQFYTEVHHIVERAEWRAAKEAE